MRLHITSPKIKGLTPAQKPYEVVDDAIKGFLARVQPSGSISYYFSYRTPDGTRKRTRIGGHPSITATTARKTAEQLAAKVTQGRDPQLEKQKARADKERSRYDTLGGFIETKYEDWANTQHRRGSETIRLLQKNFAHLYSRKLADINAWDIQKWRTEKMKAGLAASTINRRVTSLKSVLNRAVEWDVIDANPLITVSPLTVDQSARVRHLSPQEETALRIALDEREEDIRVGRNSGNAWREVRGYKILPPIAATYADYLKPMILLVLNTGMRRGEVFSLRWEDVDLSKRQIIVEGKTAKTGQTRHLPLNSEALETIQKWRLQAEGEYVFTSPVTGRRFDNIKRSWEALRTRAGLTDFRFHDLRHTFASKLVMAGENLYTVKELMGHSTVEMTEKYAHLAPELKVSAVEKLVNH